MTRPIKAPKNVCPVCMEPGGNCERLCESCSESYANTTDTISVITWAAARARGAERQRAKLAARMKRAGWL